MSNNIREISKVEYQNGFWVVLILSPVKGCGWIVQGEWATKEQADEDRRNWM